MFAIQIAKIDGEMANLRFLKIIWQETINRQTGSIIFNVQCTNKRFHTPSDLEHIYNNH